MLLKTATAALSSGSALSPMNFFSLLGGLALFLYGMHLMSASLEKSAGNKLKTILAGMTSNQFKGFLLGLGVTAVIQSSSATTVMVVGFVNSGIMNLHQAVGVIMGANLGTSVTSWITSLASVGGSHSAGFVWTDLLSTEAFVPIIALVAIFLIMFQKNLRRKDVGMILMGFAVLMFGMEMMSASLSGLKNNQQFKDVLTMFDNPLLGVLVGTVFTAIIQSSSASVGILQTITTTGAINYHMAVPIIMGQNIGTCVSALISSIGTSKNAKRAAVIHLSFNVLGTAILLTLYYIAYAFVEPFSAFMLGTASPVGIAVAHTFFKILALLIIMPFSKVLEKIANLLVRDGKQDGKNKLLDERLFASPTVAIARSRDVAINMAKLSTDSITKALSLLTEHNAKVADAIRTSEEKVDMYEDKLGSYLVKLSGEPMTELDNVEVNTLLHVIGDFERISDHAINIVESADEISDKKLSFSKEALAEIQILGDAIEEILGLTLKSFVDRDMKAAVQVEPLEQVIDHLKDYIKSCHIERLQKKECTIEMGFVLTDICTCLERVSDHCSNIAACILQMTSNEDMNIHKYLSKVKSGDAEEFKKYFNEYSEKYEARLVKKLDSEK